MLINDKIWRHQPGSYFCISTKSLTGDWTDHFFKRRDIRKIGKFLRENSNKELYFSPQGYSKGIRRLKKYAEDPHLLFADLDEADPRKLDIKPTIALESSPGRYVGFWLTDGPTNEELNRRMSYMCGADKGGWDWTQVLRIPGTKNYKYKPAARVRILWSGGPTYEVERLEKLIPAIKQKKSVDADAAGIFRKYEKKLNRWARREILSGRAVQGKRSEVLWKLQNACIEAGMSRDEAFAILWVSPWNKFKGRRNGTDQLWAELDKALDSHLEEFTANPDEGRERMPMLRGMDTIDYEDIDWIIPHMFARQELTILEGDPGLGKSYFMQMAALHMADAKRMPCVPTYKVGKPLKVAYFDLENSASRVTKVRLLENGIENQQNFLQGEVSFSVDDPDGWEDALEAIQEAGAEMVVFDTLNTYIGKADTHKASETNQALAKFKDLAVQYNCSVVLIRHLNKGSGKAIYRGQGSIAFTGTVRVVILVGRHPEDSESRVVTSAKNNLSRPFKSFSFSIEALPDTIERSNRSLFVWGEEVDFDADDVTAAEKPEKDTSRGEAKNWLTDVLGDAGEEGLAASRIEKMAEARSFSRTTVHRAATDLKVAKTKKGKTSWWSLPDED